MMLSKLVRHINSLLQRSGDLGRIVEGFILAPLLDDSPRCLQLGDLVRMAELFGDRLDR